MTSSGAEEQGETLLDLVTVRVGRPDWFAVAERARSHPCDASQTGPHGELPLHIMVHRDPSIDAVVAVLEAYPPASAVPCPGPYVYGRHPPFLIACYNDLFPAVVRMLFRAYLDHNTTVKDDKGERSGSSNGLHGINFDDLSLSATRVIMEEFPQGALGDGFGAGPGGRGSCPIDEVLDACSTATHSDADELKDGLDKLSLLLMAAASVDDKGTQSHGEKGFFLLHSLLRYVGRIGPFARHPHANETDITSILKYLVRTETSQFYKRDDDGSLPLHIASAGRDFHCPNVNGGKTANIIKLLVYVHPESARMTDGAGRHPLHIAVQHGLPCYRLIVAKSPQAVITPDASTSLDSQFGKLRGMYPFQLAALSLQSWPDLFDADDTSDPKSDAASEKKWDQTQEQKQAQTQKKKHTHRERCNRCCQIHRSTAEEDEASMVETIYNLLRENPLPLLVRSLSRGRARSKWMDTPLFKELCLNQMRTEQLKWEHLRDLHYLASENQRITMTLEAWKLREQANEAKDKVEDHGDISQDHEDVKQKERDVPGIENDAFDKMGLETMPMTQAIPTAEDFPPSTPVLSSPAAAPVPEPKEANGPKESKPEQPGWGGVFGRQSWAERGLSWKNNKREKSGGSGGVAGFGSNGMVLRANGGTFGYHHHADAGDDGHDSDISSLGMEGSLGEEPW